MKKSDLKDFMVVEIRGNEGSEGRYIVKGKILTRLGGWNKLEYYNKNLINNTHKHLDIIKVYNIISFKTSLNSLLEDDNLELIWEREETPTLTEDEKAILRNLDKRWKYIARDDRDDSDDLYLFEEKPKAVGNYYGDYYYTRVGSIRLFNFYKKLFQSIKFETGPLLIEDLINESTD